MCRNSPTSQRHQWLVFITRRERSLDPENGRKNKLTVAWSILVRGHLRAAQHTSKLSNRRLIKDCMKFSKFCDSIDSCNNHRRQQLKTPVAHNFFFNVPVFAQPHVAYFSWHLQNARNNELKEKKIQIRLPHIQLKYQFTFHFLITWQREQKFISLKIK